MPTRATAPVGAPCWIDLYTSDADRARDFYPQVFGWQASDPVEEFGGYSTFARDGVAVAGCMGAEPGVGQPDVWSVHLATADAQATLEAAVDAGGEVLFPPHPVGDLGFMARVLDPGGASVGVWQPVTFQGTGVFGEPGAPSWFELHTSSFPATVEFYRRVFGWDTVVMSDSAEFRYTTVRDPRGDDFVAGVMDESVAAADHLASHWSFYLWVDDMAATLRRVVAAGGTVVRDAVDTPYGLLAGVADPMGAAFNLQAANEAMPARS